MKNMRNSCNIEGLLYQHNLEKKVTGPESKNPGTEYITGTIEIATDNELLNIIPVHFTYVTAVTSSRKPNQTFNVLNNIIDKYPSVMADGADKAVKLKCSTALGLNEFYSNRTGTEELVSVKRNEGGFVSQVNELEKDENKRNIFEVDMLITNCSRKEADEEREIPERVIIKGAIFDYAKRVLPVEFVAYNENAMNYFEELGATSKQPVLTKLWGRQNSRTTIRTIEEETAFGEPEVREYRSTRKDFVIVNAAKETQEWDSEDTITAAELTEAMTKRETMLAELKSRSDEYRARRANSTPNISKADFDF